MYTVGNITYVDITSAKRDRNVDSITKFTVPVSNVRNLNGKIANDPVANSAPIKCWTAGAFDNDTRTSIVSLNLGNINSSDTQNIYVFAPTFDTLQDTGYYNGAILTTTAGQRLRISSYTWLGENRALIKLESSLNSISVGDVYTISDPTILPNIFVPNSPAIQDYYKGYYLYNETNLEWRIIDTFDANSRMINIRNAPAGWTNDDNYCIRKELPIGSYSTTALSTDREVIVVDAPINVSGVQSGSWLRCKSSYYGRGQDINANSSRRIVDWQPNFFLAIVEPPFTDSINIGNLLEILPFSYDNLTPLISNNVQEIASTWIFYEMELLNLIIPRTSIVYPYLYVRISSIVQNSNVKNSLLSNDKEADYAVFKARITASNSLKSIIYVADGMKQIVAFNPTCSFLVEVKTPDNFSLNVGPDSSSPLAPIPEIQVSITFSYKKVYNSSPSSIFGPPVQGRQL